MPTMKELYGGDDPDGDHEACPNCGWCLVCDGCGCDWIAEDPENREAMRFPYKKE